MLASLEIRDIVLIERLSLAFEPGLTVLTGETGAGKSILLDALGFALGRRGRGGMVRAGATEGAVTAVFELPQGHAVGAVLAEAGLRADPDGTLILRRVQGEGGPARAFVNDQRTSADTLARIGAYLVEVHGQRDDRGLLDPRMHRTLLDAYGGLGDLATGVAEAWAARRAAEDALSSARARLSQAAADADYLRHAAAELAKLDPQEGEDAALDTERRAMQAAERIRGDVARAGELVSVTAEGALADALSRLTDAAREAEALLAPPVEALDRAMVEISEAAHGIEAALEAMEVDPGRLDAVEERLFAIRALARKHKVMADELPGLAAEFSERLAAIDGGEARIAELTAAARDAGAVYDAAATRLSEARREAATRLDAAVTAELGPLRMEAARFETAIGPGEPGPAGIDRVGFTATTNPGTPPGAIERIASGGELSRFLLALKVCLAGRAEGLAMIFDEIDRGVGGATAAAVGRRLARLAAGAQVLVVTHSPQVAAQGAHHLHIAKSAEGGVTRTSVRALSDAERRDEIARMLAGDEITAEARSAAEALMAASA